jgi:hypothetical protein
VIAKANLIIRYLFTNQAITMRKIISFFGPVVSFTLLLFAGFISCRKTDQNPLAQTSIEKPATENFFFVSPHTENIVHSIAKKIYRQNEHKSFAGDLVERAGYPKWDHSLIAVGPGNMRRATQQESVALQNQERIIVYIPFIKETEQKTTAILQVIVDGADTVFNMLYPQQYKKYGFKKAKSTAWDAQTLFSVFADFDYDLFGTTRYIVKDGRIFGKKKEDLLIVARKPAEETKNDVAAKIASITICASWESCVYASESTGSGGSCTTVESCSTYWFEDGAGAITDTGMPATGGDNGGNTDWTNDPCAGVVRRLVEEEPSGNISGSESCDEVWINLESEVIPCPSSFNFVKQGNWQSAVITDYSFGLLDRNTKKVYTVNIGMIEVGMPSVTYHGTEISKRTAQNISTEAAFEAESKVTRVLNAQIIVSPGSPIDNQYYKNMFKEVYLEHLNKLLRRAFYNGENVSPARIGYDSRSFSLKDQSQYRTLKFFGRDC